MSEPSEEEKETAVTTIRGSVKDNIRIARLKHRQDELDKFRITLGDAEEDLINFQSFDVTDVMEIAKRIKKQRNAGTTDLIKLGHAFLQNTDNIDCFVSTKTGALNVIIKEMTNVRKTEKQILAVECLCNLSLGLERSSESVARSASSYLHTFLQNSNESIVRTTLWCLTNLIASGQKPFNILLKQELIKGLINVTQSIHSKSLKAEAYVPIELVLDNFQGVPRSSDIETISDWILCQSPPLDIGMTRIIYKILNLLNFQSNDAIGIQKLVHICFDTLFHLYESTNTVSPLQSERTEILHQVVLLMRICSNIVALENSFADYIIKTWFSSCSMASFFNHFIDLLTDNHMSVNEIYWFIGNLLNSQLNESTINYLECDEFFVKIKMNDV